MYYIVNKKNNIIAVDESLLKLLNVNNIDELQEKMILNKINFDYSLENSVKIGIENDLTTYNMEKHNISCVIGDITLVEVTESKSISEEIVDELPKDDIGISFTDNINEETIKSSLSLLQDTEIEEKLELDSPFIDDIIEKTPLVEKDNIDFSLNDENDDLAEKAILEQKKQEEIEFSFNDEISIDNETEVQPDDELSLSLVDDVPELPITKEDTIEEIVKTDNDDLFDFDSDKLFDLDKNIDEPVIEDDLFDIMSDDLLKDETPIETEPATPIDNNNSLEDDLFDIMSNDTPKIEPVEDPIEVEEKIPDTVVEATPLTIDIADVSQQIGISEDDYNVFLSEYIDTAVNLEDDLKS